MIWLLPPSSRKAQFSASAYFWRNWKICPTSMPRRCPGFPCRRVTGRRPPHCGCRRRCGSGRSRPKLTPVRWKPSSLAPQTKSLMAATLRSARSPLFHRRPQQVRYSRACSRGIPRLRLPGKTEGRQAGNLAGLDFIQFVVATQQQQRECLAAVDFLATTAMALTVCPDASARNSATSSQAILPGVAIFLHGLGRRGAWCTRRQRLGQFDVGSVVRVRAEGDGVFAGVGQHVEFVRAGAADRAGVRSHGAKLQAESGEDAAVGVVHVPVFALQIRERGMERVAVLHQELAAAHDAEARADLVAELGLDLVKMERQLAIALDVAAYDVGDDFFVGRANHEFALVAILEAQQFRSVLVPSAPIPAIVRPVAPPASATRWRRPCPFPRARCFRLCAARASPAASTYRCRRGRLMKPARSISLWLTISASLGASLSVVKKNCEVRMRSSEFVAKQRFYTQRRDFACEAVAL